MARLFPHGPGHGSSARHLGHEIGRKLARLVVIAAGDADEAGLIGIKGPAAELIFELADQPADLV